MPLKLINTWDVQITVLASKETTKIGFFFVEMSWKKIIFERVRLCGVEKKREKERKNERKRTNKQQKNEMRQDER